MLTAALKFQRSLRDEVLLPDIFHTKPEKSDTPTFYNLIRFVPSSLSFYGAYLMGGTARRVRRFVDLAQPPEGPESTCGMCSCGQRTRWT